MKEINKKLLNILERKTLIESDKVNEEKAYQEWILNAPYKFSTSLLAGRCLIYFYDNFDKTFQQQIINRILLFIFFVLNICFFFQMFGSWKNKQIILHYTDQINRLNQKIKEILEGEKQE